MRYNVLIVDDEETLANMTAEYFNVFGVITITVNSKEACLNFLGNNQADLILLDINLIESNGFDLCRIIRKDYDTPIFFISARVSTNDMLIALNIGGDDYITKPYELSVLLAKVKARLKRDENKKENKQTVKDIRLDFSKMKAYYQDNNLNLKAKEFKLLSFLITNKNKVVTKEEILENVWEDTYITDGALNVQISRLREKLAGVDYIKTVWGKGYIFEVES
ncbi:MAG: response regulator transcription factor [Erysipelotrichales bacterium]|nr:response regulator transcription factor [Erysipelotrichales bacterium]